MLQPLPASRWNYQTAAHLLNRAGFGGSPADIEKLAALAPGEAVASLVNLDPAPDPAIKPDWAHPDPARIERLRSMRTASFEEKKKVQQEYRREESRRMQELRTWWLQRMVSGYRPLQEKMTLFWHGHFATSVQKVKETYLMYLQNETFRQNALGNWYTMLVASSKDPAMLIWLDNARSRPGSPNENFAREVMELFSLGEGHYTEQDIKEAARAFTGWSIDRGTLEFKNRPMLHDNGEKTFMAKTGRLSGEDIIRQIVDQPQSARFITAKLWNFFAGDEPSNALGASLAGAFRDAGGEFKPVLTTIFSSEEFYAPKVMRAQVKSPTQWLVSSVRQLERSLPPSLIANNVIRTLGQDLFNPPNVKGWDGGIAWVTTNNLLNRYNYSAMLVEGMTTQRPREEQMMEGMKQDRVEKLINRFPQTVAGADMATLFPPETRKDPETLLAAMEKRFLQSALKEKRRATLKEYLAKASSLDDATVAHATRLIMCTPDFQLC